MIVIMSESIYSIVVESARAARTLTRDAFLFHQGDAVASVFVVATGSVELTRFQSEGAPLVLQRAGRGSFLAEASVHSAAYHCAAVAAEPSSVFEMHRDAFLELLAARPDAALAWSRHLASAVQSARYRAEILALKTVAERLDGWLAWNGDALPARGKWKDLAHEIGVSPEALYRELAKRGRRA
jgi:CRP-like cAMP-binding protein